MRGQGGRSPECPCRAPHRAPEGYHLFWFVLTLSTQGQSCLHQCPTPRPSARLSNCILAHWQILRANKPEVQIVLVHHFLVLNICQVHTQQMPPALVLFFTLCNILDQEKVSKGSTMIHLSKQLFQLLLCISPCSVEQQLYIRILQKSHPEYFAYRFPYFSPFSKTYQSLCLDKSHNPVLRIAVK